MLAATPALARGLGGGEEGRTRDVKWVPGDKQRQACSIISRKGNALFIGR